MIKIFKDIYRYFNPELKIEFSDYNLSLEQICNLINEDDLKMSPILTYKQSFLTTKEELISFIKENTSNLGELLIYGNIFSLLSGEREFIYNNGNSFYNIEQCKYLEKNKNHEEYNTVVLYHFNENMKTVEKQYKNHIRKIKLNSII